MRFVWQFDLSTCHSLYEPVTRKLDKAPEQVECPFSVPAIEITTKCWRQRFAIGEQEALAVFRAQSRIFSGELEVVLKLTW